MKIKIIIFLTGLLLYSCGEKSTFNQLKGKGEIISQQILVDDFYSIHVYDDLNLVLNNDSVNCNQISIVGDENIIQNIEVKCENSILSIRNKNRFKWLNNYDCGVKITVSSHFVSDFVMHDAANVETIEPIEQDTIRFKALDASGSANIAVHCKYLHVYSPLGMSDVSFRGTAISFYCYNADMGFINASGLQCNYVHIHDFGTNNMYAPQCHQIGVSIENVGDVFYSGNPVILWEEYKSSGRLKKI